jgi:hypothetical protein
VHVVAAREIPVSLIILVLIVALIGGLYLAKKRIVDHEGPRGDARPDDPPPQFTPGDQAPSSRHAR